MHLKRPLVALAFVLALTPLSMGTRAGADDANADAPAQSDVILRTYDVRDLAVTNDDLAGLSARDGTSWKPQQVSMKDGLLVVRGSAAEHEALARWIASRRAAKAREDSDQPTVDELLAALMKRHEGIQAHMAEIETQGQACAQRIEQLTGASQLSETTRLELAELEARRAALDEAGVRAMTAHNEVLKAIIALRQPDSDQRRKAAAELLRNRPERGKDGKLYYGEIDFPRAWGHSSPRARMPNFPLPETRRDALARFFYPDIEDAAHRHIDRLTSRANALEQQHADLQRRTNVIQDVAARLGTDEPERRKSLDNELVRIDQTRAELAAKREALVVQKAQLESALAEKRLDELRELLARLDEQRRHEELSRSSLRTQQDFDGLTSYAGRRNSSLAQGSGGGERLLEEIRALRAEVREVKALVLKLLEQDAAEADARSAR